MLLGDNGADVIKVEPPGGDLLRATPAWRMWNRGKRSVVLDIWSDEGRAAAVELMGSADVVLQNWPVGAAEANRVDYETVAGMFPRLVYATVTAMGPVGPYASLPCDGAVVEARGGGCMDLSAWIERSAVVQNPAQLELRHGQPGRARDRLGVAGAPGRRSGPARGPASTRGTWPTTSSAPYAARAS